MTSLFELCIDVVCMNLYSYLYSHTYRVLVHLTAGVKSE